MSRLSAPSVSVIVPAFNAERFIAATLQSILAQEFTDLEIIVVDDGSTDSTRDVVTDTPGVHYHFQRNQGPASARNTGLNLARGEYVAFVDSDDCWHPRMLSTCVGILQTNSDIGAVHARWALVDESGKVVQGQTGWKPWRGDIFERLIVEIALTTPSVVWRRSLWEEIGGYDLSPEVNDDWLNWLRIAYRGTIFEYVQEPLVYVRKHSSNLTKLQTSRVLRWRVNALENICLECHVPTDVRRRAFTQTFWSATVESMKNNNLIEAADYFKQAVYATQSILVQRSTYFELAFAHVGKVFGVEPILDRSEEDIRYLLDSLFGTDDLPEPVAILKRTATSLAYLCLSQIAYGLDGRRRCDSLRYLVRSLMVNPAIVLHFDYAMWILRILLGRQFIGLVHHLLKNIGNTLSLATLERRRTAVHRQQGSSR